MTPSKVTAHQRQLLLQSYHTTLRSECSTTNRELMRERWMFWMEQAALFISDYGSDPELEAKNQTAWGAWIEFGGQA